MKGFDPRFRDMRHYILDITEEIWERRGLGPSVREYYTEDSTVRDPMGITVGAEGVVAAVLQTLHEFPDRQLFGEDVIWAEHDKNGYFASHRVFATAHHHGDGRLGEGTGKPVRYRVIADTGLRDNKIYEEWLVRDNGAIARCIGLTPRELAERQIVSGDDGFFLPENDRPGSFEPMIESDGPSAHYADTVARIWNEAATGLVKELYDRGAAIELPSGASAMGPGELDRFFVSWLASFPEATFTLENLVSQTEPGRPRRVSAKWSLRGRHEGYGRFGAPTGRDVYVMGLSHAHLHEDTVIAEWVTIDEVAVWKQVLAGTVPVENRESEA